MRHPRHLKHLFATVLQGIALTLGITAASQAALAQDAAKAPRPDMVLKGDAKCTRCHDESEEYPVLSIAKTRHGITADGRTPTCTSCHGESDSHINRPEGAKERPKPERAFGKGSANSAMERNQACLGCHESGMRMHWKGSQHEAADIACASCHKVHAGKDHVLTKATQPEVCFTCHKAQRAQSNQASAHPVKDGKIACSSCHNPHGSAGPKQLIKGTLNETCYTCHAEKRGPFLWEHPPAREDCSNCHTPHGSMHAPLLKARGPWLCQECHMASFHPSTAYSGAQVPPIGVAQQLLAKNCLNCHVQVHGSNHPSGARKTR